MFQRRRMASPAIPVASMSDIAFLLIVFFMLTTTFNKPKGIDAEFPSSEKTKEKKKKKDDTIDITPKEFYWGGSSKPISVAELKKKLQSRKYPQKSEKDRSVVIQLKKDTPYERYFVAVNLIAEAGAFPVLIIEDEKGGN